MVYSGLIKQAAAHRSRNGRGSMIPTATMAAMAAVLLLTVVLPIGVILFLRKHGGSWGAFFTGAGTFVLFALILEPVLHNLVLGSAAGAAIQENILLYGLYGGLAAGVFEETGRLMAFRFVLKKQGKRITALSYGIGHGGIEAFLLVGLTMAANLALALSAGNAALPTEAAAAVETLASTPAAMFLWSGLDRISAIALHMANSVLVFASLRAGKRWLFPAAILAHGAVNFAAMVSNAYLPVAATEGIVLVLTAAVVFWAAQIYKNLPLNAENP